MIYKVQQIIGCVVRVNEFSSQILPIRAWLYHHKLRLLIQFAKNVATIQSGVACSCHGQSCAGRKEVVMEKRPETKLQQLQLRRDRDASADFHQDRPVSEASYSHGESTSGQFHVRYTQEWKSDEIG